MSIQNTILNAIGSLAKVKGAQRALTNQEAHLELQRQKLGIAQESVNVRQAREARMAEESESKQEYYRKSADKFAAQGQNLKNKAMLDKIAIQALERSLKQQDMKLTQRQIQARIKKVRDQVNGEQPKPKPTKE